MKKLKTTLSGLTLSAMMMVAGMTSPALADRGGEDDRDLPAFTKIVVKGAIELNVKSGKKQTVHLETDNIRPDDITTIVEDGILYIATKHRRKIWRDVEVAVEIDMEKFTAIEVHGAVDGDIEGIDSDVVDIHIRGAADLQMSGKCGKVNLLIKGAGDLDTRDMICENAYVELRGAGSAEVHATQSAEAYLRGVGDIEIYGKPEKVKKKVSGIGSIDVD